MTDGNHMLCNEMTDCGSEQCRKAATLLKKIKSLVFSGKKKFSLMKTGLFCTYKSPIP